MGGDMQEEIQAWLFPAMQPHLTRARLNRLVERARVRRAAAERWLSKGSVNVRTRIEPFHLDDLEQGRVIEYRALTVERKEAWFADELWDTDGEYLRIAATEWRRAGRDDRAEFLEQIANEIRDR